MSTSDLHSTALSTGLNSTGGALPVDFSAFGFPQLITKALVSLPGELVSSVIGARLTLGDAEVTVTREGLKAVLTHLKGEGFLMLLCLSGVDYFDNDFTFRLTDDRFEVVYHLLAIPTSTQDDSQAARLRVKVGVPESDPSVDSVVSLWAGAAFMEREVWDMYGIRFNDLPDHRRILMYDEFVGHPLRKDYPIQAKQPRIPLLSPEVENTARLMKRPSLSQGGLNGLVQIRGRAN